MSGARLLPMFALGIAAMTPGTAFATGNDAAALRIYSGSTELNWFGVGTPAASVNLCVVSTTGRFRLDITSSRGGALLGPGAIPYEITFRDGAGSETTSSTAGHSMLSFEGTARPAADCSAGPNAQLRVRIPVSNLTRGVAGSYFDQLQFSVTAL